MDLSHNYQTLSSVQEALDLRAYLSRTINVGGNDTRVLLFFLREIF